MSVRDLLSMAWICMRRSIIETNDARLADELDRSVATLRKPEGSIRA